MKAMPCPRRLLAALLAAPLLALAQGAAAPGDAPAPPAQRKAKQALDDRADPNMHASEVGKGTHFARKPLPPGAYFNDRHRDAVRRFYTAHPGKARGGNVAWRIGEPLPAEASVHAVPRDLVGQLPKMPPGLRYMQVGSDILLVANGTHMVVDGITGLPAR